ncbi:carbon storage regulator CsrA [Proteiniborus sp. MB09-C3]|uniref:carbon storage regulator CsrA n=1 Tax=Proteiniborus sp. MB09-C3 TaxID=3050072 RepID=UPI0025543F86|nr:carbon storage regulator CsrA [Proteiniborus sp. MB09-C3]WIV12047.1 carbon storage regulator CsrA [Proteiniborus sp. MB09-C3]
MLILTRKTNESIVINNNIEIIVVGIEDGKVKLGINAPKNIDIHRKEIYENIKAENKYAAQPKSIDLSVLEDLLKKSKF